MAKKHLAVERSDQAQQIAGCLPDVTRLIIQCRVRHEGTEGAEGAEGSMQANYYMVLGVTQQANPSQIRRAYRQRSNECRPGQTPRDTQRFEQLTAAFQTLSDPAERARYDQQLASATASAPSPARPIDIVRDFESHRPSLEEIVATIARNYHHRGEPKSVRPRGLAIEMVISPEDAQRGTSLAFSVPVFRSCSSCEGTGHGTAGVCEHCRGTGNEQYGARVDVIVPGGTVDGAIIPVSLRHLGVRNLYLQVRLRVA